MRCGSQVEAGYGHFFWVRVRPFQNFAVRVRVRPPKVGFGSGSGSDEILGSGSGSELGSA